MINSICRDKSDKCNRMKVYCNIYSYQELMMRECPKTCNLCISKNTTIPDNVITLSKMMTIPTCYKSDSHKCKSLKNLCKNNTYEKIMKKECPVTCGICKLQKIDKKKIMKSLRRENEDNYNSMIHIKYLISILLFLTIFIACEQKGKSDIKEEKLEEIRKIQALSFSVNDIDQRHINDGTEDDTVKEETLPKDFTLPGIGTNPPGDDIDMSKVEQLEDLDEESDEEEDDDEEEEKK
uniref:ShKT domain-containing protein n=1 Tax=Strongyloides venezuelensis TaxID=75913 RepID=A0A0K0FAQ5_STRVS